MAGSLAIVNGALASADAVQPTQAGGLPPDEMRFTLELKAPADLLAVQAALQQLVPPNRFLLEALDAGKLTAGCFHVLRFPTLERVFSQHVLFEIGYALVDALGLRSCEPDLGAQVFLDPDPAHGSPAVEASLLGSLCWTQGQAPTDKGWALKNARLDAAHAVSRGKAIIVGHLDTGITEHEELGGGMFDLSKAANMLNGGTDATDPLRPGMTNPGHGTSTSSVLASRSKGVITGAAPEAMVVPVRCIDDVKVFNTAPVAKAVSHAVQSGCHVISMSLGGLAGSALRAAIADAIARDVIVVAASGNCVGMVVWPARYPDVVATGGTGPSDQPWKGSSRGSRVVVSAPAEFVWRAESDASHAAVSASQGTSYATALVAGAAALWLSAHGRNQVIVQARIRYISVARLFITALQMTARTPADWDQDLGAGILDADKLVRLPLADIPHAFPESSTPGLDGSVEELLLEQFGPATPDPAFKAGLFETELSAIAVSQARFERSLGNLTPEAKSEGTRPSPQLALVAGASLDLRIRRFGISSQSSVARPLLANPSASSASDAGRATLLLPQGIIAESATSSEAMDALKAYLDADAGKKLLEQANEFIATSGAPSADRQVIGDSVRKFVSEMGQHGSVRSREAQLGLEALVEMKGRPALRVRGGSVDDTDPRAEQWGMPLYILKTNSQFKARVDAVGRVDHAGVHVGTGWVVGDGLVLTNRHVLQEIAYPSPTKNNPIKWELKDTASAIDFSEQPAAHTQMGKFEILALVEAGSSYIDPYLLDFRKPDFALLRVKTTSVAGNNPLPQPLDLLKAHGLMDVGRDVAVIGYPARMGVKPLKKDGQVDIEGMQRLQALFAADYGTKYFSPGTVRPAQSFEHGSIAHTVCHNATTLGGNSGSVIASFDEPMKAVGLHFAGAWRKENFAHSLRGLWDMGYLRVPGINWVH
jgi:serine protease